MLREKDYEASIIKRLRSPPLALQTSCVPPASIMIMPRPTDLRVSKTKQISAIPPSFHRAHLLQNSHDSSSIPHQRRVEPASLVNA
jgi:hypothetical protein